MTSSFKLLLMTNLFFLSNLAWAGPGRSGGANAALVSDSPHKYGVVDIIESGKVERILSLEKELPSYELFKKLLSQLKNINIDLPDYLSEAYTKKQWYFVNSNISNTQCENGTLLDTTADEKIILVCQFQNNVYINKNAYLAIKDSFSQLTVLVHEGLVNQMLKYLISLENKYSTKKIDKLQKQIEIVIHRISVKLANRSYKNFLELNSDLIEASLPRLYSPEEKQSIYISPEPEKFILSSEYYIGAKEKFELMTKLFENAQAFRPDILQKKYGSEACMVNYAGSSNPGHWVGAYVRLDEFIPELLFTTQMIRFDSYKFDEKKLLQNLNDKIALTPLKKNEHEDWSGQITFSIDAIEKAVGDMKNIEPADKDYFEKYIQYQRSLGSQRLIQLDIRQINKNAIIIRRFVYSKAENKLQLISSDYGIGNLKKYPNDCASEQ